MSYYPAGSNMSTARGLHDQWAKNYMQDTLPLLARAHGQARATIGYLVYKAENAEASYKRAAPGDFVQRAKLFCIQ